MDLPPCTEIFAPIGSTIRIFTGNPLKTEHFNLKRVGSPIRSLSMYVTRQVAMYIISSDVFSQRLFLGNKDSSSLHTLKETRYVLPSAFPPTTSTAAKDGRHLCNHW